MTAVEIADGKLVMTVHGFDVVLALKKSLTVPLQHVRGASIGITDEMKQRIRQSLRLPGTYLPGVIRAGQYLEHGRWMFWNVHGSGENAVTIELAHEKFDALVIDVERPADVVTQIKQAIAR